ncbi:dynein heavy chain 6, axonemal [Drosophila sechellia]|uniref:dynein heavy chain 6, axonemal n=1 Tax=Drosophila sechellia TaxID=7238 RepID=UPI0013DE120E|nr:dynein heavy chain 6, axonemal [Drosophila sechellia]
MSGMYRQLLPKGKDRTKIKIKGKEKEREREEDDDGSRKTRERGRSRRQSAGGGDHSGDMGFKRVTGDERPSSMSMDRLDSDFTAFTDRASDANDGSITGPADGSEKKAQAGSSGKHKRASKHRLNFSTLKSGGSATGNKSRSASTTKITTGASLIPDLNLIINRMRNMPDDSFVYMDYMLPHDSEYFTPYSLREVEYKDLNTYEPFYTVTRHGVTFWHCSENFFTPLDQWQQEFKQFLSIIQIRSFSIFRLWKGFKVWEKTIKWRKLNEARDFLQNNLFIVIPQLGKAILRMRSDIVQLQRLNFVNVSNIENWHPFYFLETHMRIYEQLHKTFTDFREFIAKTIFRACTDAIQARGFYPDDEVNYYPSLKKMREAHSFMDRARKRAFCKTLTNFLTYCDMMVYQMLYRITIKSFEDLATSFEVHDEVGPSEADINRHDRVDKRIEKQRPQDKPQSPFFLAMLRLLPDRIDIEPSEDIIRIIFQRITGLILETVLEIHPFTTDPFFTQYTQPSIMGRQEEVLYDGAPDLHYLLRADIQFQYNRKNMFVLIRNAYERARLYTQRFHQIRENFEIDNSTDPTVLNTERDLQLLRAYCDRYCNNVRALDGILEYVFLGLLKLTQTNFKDTVTPVCSRLQNVLATYLPKLAEEETTRLYEEAQDFHGRICYEPHETLEIVAHIRFLDKCSTELDGIFDGIDYVHDLLLIIKDFGIPIDDDSKEDYMDTEDYLNRTRETLEEIREKRQEFINRLEDAMQDDIAALKEEIHEVAVEAMQPWLLDANSNRLSVTNKLDSMLEHLNKCRETADEFLGYQKEFQIDLTMYDEMASGFYDIRMRQNLYRTWSDWEESLAEWIVSDFNTLNVVDMVELNSKTIKNCMQFQKYLPENNIVPVLQKSAEAFKEKLPVIGYLRNPNLRARHWAEIEDLLNRKFFQEKDILIQTYEDVHAFDDVAVGEALMQISSQATGEVQLENMLKGIETTWKETELSIVPHHDAKDVFILAGTEELQAVLDDSNVNINTIAASKFVGPIKGKVDEWINAMDQFAKTFESWMDCQGAWIYLEAIFASADIQRQLPQEAKMFFTVDKSFKETVRQAKKVALALPTMSSADVHKVLVENNRLLDLISRGLEAYLEVKRVVFPRFYFLSNDELLEILAQTRIPQAVQPHLRKCFDAIYRLEFGSKEGGDGKMVATNDIVAFLSPEGEKLQFGKGLKARGAVEEWLSKVEEAMFVSCKRYMRFGYQCYPAKEREDWFQDHPNQVVLTVSQVQWAADIHRIYEGKERNPLNILEKMAKFEIKCLKDLGALAALTRKNISSLLRKILCALITIDVHAKDSVRMLIEKEVCKASDFNWLKMLRFYWADETETVYSRMAAANIPYYYEYLGAGGVLVLTPLTDRCYLCLMGAFQMDLGGAPAGPAGTGKTETTKDLAKALAKQCVVFNCSDGLDYKMMGRFFSGLAQCGAWCCFDEFNRIDIEVLSVIAQQLITIRTAKAMRVKRFIFEGREIKINRSCCVFITMNPGYAGRTELPDNLKALFRPISMMVPDYALISEVILYSEGFEDPKILARKMVQMYQLCSQQLSQQNHYDFGMRAVKSVLVMAGALKRASPNQREDITLIAALRDSNIPKFLADDAVLFRGILSDLFPGVELPDSQHPHLEASLRLGLRQKNLQAVPTTIRKCLQLYETMCVRWGVMLVGPTGGGKSVVLHALEFALSHLFENEVQDPNFRPVVIQTMNPKAVTMNELYGYVDLKTLEWQDGLLGLAVRTATTVEDEIHQWIMCDGPVDAVWIENLNTVLDDNKMLCLANSERIKLTAWIHMLFEVQDLLQASPATVSRCGMVYVDPGDLGWIPLIDTWREVDMKHKLPAPLAEFCYQLFVGYFDKALKIERKRAVYTIHQVLGSKVRLCCELTSAQLEAVKWSALGEEQGKELVTKIFAWAVLWAIASNLKDAEKVSFEEQWSKAIAQHPNMTLPNFTLWNYRIDLEKMDWGSWLDIMAKFVFDPETSYYDMQVPTVDTTKYGYVADLLFKRGMPVMVTGDTGVGKTVLAISCMKRLSQGNVIPVILNFSAQTSSMRTQEMIEGPLEKRKKTQLGAPVGKTVIVFIDDVNMPKLDTYGASPAIELLRQFLDFKGFYDREKLYWKEILDVVLGCACAPPGGGRNPLTPRFVRHFALFSLPKPNEETLTQIFNGILRGFLQTFSSAVRALSEPMVNACVDVYMRVATVMLPTPDKSHYIFNLRDLSKCIQGILQASNLHYNQENQILRLFYHETTRVFHDRLINIEDKNIFKTLMKEVCLDHFNRPVINDNEPPILFGDFMVFGKPKNERIYDEIRDHAKLESVLNDYIADYNSVAVGKQMKLILFQDAMEHTVRLARLLRSDRGNGLLVGVAGMGKQSLTRLASHVNEYNCWQIEMRRNYDLNAFHEDLRVLYRIAGIDNQPVTFLLIDSQIVEEEFLEDINNILNSGEVPNLFEGDEFEKIILDARDGCNENRKDDPCTRDDIYKFFINRVRNNLHVVMSMSPVGDAFRRRCRMFPSLVNCTTIDWFTSWPTEALYSVALGLLTKIAPKMEDRISLASTTVFMHKTVEDASVKFYKEMKRHYYTTPSSYLELLKLYQNLLKIKNMEIIAKRKRIANGLNKLLETNEVIAVMGKELEVMVPQLDEKSAMMKSLVDNLTKETKQADAVKQSVLEDEMNAKEKAAVAQAISEDAGKDLEIAMPALREAEDALKGLTKADINELKSFTTPPALVQFCMEAVCILLGVKPTWASAKAIMADINFIKRLFEYDKEHMKEDTLKKVKKYIDHKDFVPAKFEKVSKVAKSMSMWVISMDKFSKVYKVVEPKIKRKEAAEAELKEVMTVLRQKQKELAAVEAKIQGLRDSLEEKQREFQVIQDNVDLTYGRINRAGRLTSALSDEQVRWRETVKSLTGDLACVPGDVLVAAACVAYLGAFSHEYRRDMSALWVTKCREHKIPSSPEFNLLKVLGDPYEMRQWNVDGLPKDNISIENGIYATRALRWALMIDPQEQANRWIRNMERANNLQVIKMTDSTMMRVLENAVRQGYPVLLEEINETIDPSLRPILQRETYRFEGRTYLKLGDMVIDYDDNFKLYMTTKLPNPHYLPEVCINVTLVNFLVTESGLEDQLLADIVAIELPAMEIQRNDLVVKINSDKQQLLALEDKVLKLLFNSEGNILDDEELVETLNDAKETSLIIAARLIDTEETEKVITASRERYRILASRGAILYFVVAGLAEIDPMYQYSLKYFTQVFCNVLRLDHPPQSVEVRISTLMTDELRAIFDNISRGLFENHKIIFSFLLALSVERQEGRVTEEEFLFLSRGPVGNIRTKTQPAKIKMSQIEWDSCIFLEDNFRSFFGGFTDELDKPFFIQMQENKEVFDFAQTNQPPTDKWNKRLRVFHKLMFISAFRKPRFLLNVVCYLQSTVGKYFTEASGGTQLSSVYLDTSAVTPLIFVLSTGSDPMSGFLKFTTQMQFTDKYYSISLGQGQGPLAENLIEKSLRLGHWVFLQNCHLATSFMQTLETIVRNLTLGITKAHVDFRLYLSSMPIQTFPISVLQNSVKITNEPPKGIKANVFGALTDLKQDFFEQHIQNGNWRAIVFGLCMFHAVLLERRKFGPLGWNITYEFSESDRECGLKTLDFFIDREVLDEIPWEAILYINGDITWGGRVTDYWDLRCLRTILTIFSSKRIIQPDYKYCRGDSYYRDPRKKTLTEYSAYVQGFPVLEDPEIFGMNQNANIVFQTKETSFFINTLLLGQPRSAADEGQAMENEIAQQTIARIQKSLANKIKREPIHDTLSVLDAKGQVPSLTIVLVQEIDRFNIALGIIHDSLVNLSKAIKGLVVMSEELENVFKALLSNQVPASWAKRSFLSIKPLPSYISDFQRRIDFIQQWAENGAPRSYWISGFFFPQSFLTGVLQTYARRRVLPIDSLKIDFDVFERELVQQDFFEMHTNNMSDQKLYGNLPECTDAVINVHGIFIEAARWDLSKGGLCDANFGELFSRMPVVRFKPCLEISSTVRYEAPLYKTQQRSGVLSTTGHSTNFILAVLLRSHNDPEFWIMRGTALVSAVLENIC